MQHQQAEKLPNRFTIEYGTKPLEALGPQFFCRWSVPEALAEAMRNGGRLVPKPIEGALLLDTGATRTCIAQKTAEDLGLQPRRMQDGFGAGGEHRNEVFLARLEIRITHPQTGHTQAYAWEQEVEGIRELHRLAAPLVWQGQAVPVTGLLGRDILRHARVHYDGPAGKLRFEFDIKSLQGDPSR